MQLVVQVQVQVQVQVLEQVTCSPQQHLLPSQGPLAPMAPGHLRHILDNWELARWGGSLKEPSAAWWSRRAGVMGFIVEAGQTEARDITRLLPHFTTNTLPDRPPKIA